MPFGTPVAHNELLRRMDIGIVIPQLEKYGGAERFLVECLRAWQDRHDLTLYASSINEQMLEEHGVGKAVRRSVLSPNFEGPQSLLLNATLLPKIWRQEIGRHEVYHTHLWPTHLVDLHPMVWYPHEPLRILHDLRFEHNVEHIGGAAARNLHLYPKYNYDRIGDANYEAYLAAVEAIDQTARPERIVANSRYSADYLRQIYGQAVEDVVYPGVTPGDFLDLPSDPNLFVTVSQLWAHKRVNLLIEAVALLDAVQLMVIGDGPELPALRSLAQRLGVADRVFFLSGLTNHELRLVLARSNGFLFAPINEPFGIVVLEAMAAGKPILAVNQGGYVEVCEPEYSFLLPPFPSAFAERMSYLREHPAESKAMGQASRSASVGFGWQRTTDDLERIIEQVWEQSTARSGRPPAGSHRTLIGAQYYLWYGDGFGAAHWNDSTTSGYVADRPMLGYYSSTKGQTITYHLELFEKMNLDYVILNLHVDENGANGLELVAIQHLFDIVGRRGSPVKFAIQIAPYVIEADGVVRVVNMIDALFAGHPNYLRVQDRPALFWFWSSGYDRSRPILLAIRNTAASFCNIAMSLRLPTNDEALRTFGVFAGFAPFSPLELSAAENWEKTWNAAYLAADRAGMSVRVATVSPGYDDSALNDPRRVSNPFRKIPRAAGATYERSLAFARGLAPRPELVVISTFNELHENTHIEPTQDHGSLYVDMTARFIDEWRESEAAESQADDRVR